MKIDPNNDLFEFRFHYHFQDSIGFSDKYFLAHDVKEAKEMLTMHAAKEQHLHCWTR